MKRILVFLMVLALCLTGCEKPLVPAATGVQAVPTTVPETTVPVFGGRKEWWGHGAGSCAER